MAVTALSSSCVLLVLLVLPLSLFLGSDGTSTKSLCGNEHGREGSRETQLLLVTSSRLLVFRLGVEEQDYEGARLSRLRVCETASLESASLLHVCTVPVFTV